ncbi:MAG: hypothetical protein HW398_189 [Acidobacteria bacterium]|nr:hypothetical protein [Acidobacteriota bacterium]
MEALLLPVIIPVVSVVVVVGALFFWLDKCVSRHERDGGS